MCCRPFRLRPMTAFLPVLLLACSGLSGAHAADPRIRTAQGVTSGTDDGTVTRFLGIPYAAPPVGSLRFAPPASPPSHPGVLAATSYGASCPQGSALGTPSENEDCLTLNIFRPDAPNAKPRPILVFLYGGSFKYGSAAPGPAADGPNYDGGILAGRADAIVVTLNYRLGLLGFLALPVLDRDDPRHVSGNYGLLDQQAALRWIRDEAVAFGGDPRRITLFGQSAGAVSVAEQMVAPGARLLFGAADLESPGALPSSSLADAETRDAPVLDHTGCADAADPVACLRAVPVKTLLDPSVTSGALLAPNVDGTVIPVAPERAFADGSFNRVPTVLLTNHDEGTYFIADGVNTLGHAVTDAELSDTLIDSFGQHAAAIEAEYSASTDASPGQLLSAIVTDEFFSCPAATLRDTLAQHVAVLQTEFSQPNPIQDYPVPTAPGIEPRDAHTSELAYVFGHDGAGTRLPAGPNRDLSDMIIDGLGALTRAAGTTLPTGLAPPAGTVLDLHAAPALSTRFADTHHCAFWNASGIAPTLIEAIK